MKSVEVHRQLQYRCPKGCRSFHRLTPVRSEDQNEEIGLVLFECPECKSPTEGEQAYHRFYWAWGFICEDCGRDNHIQTESPLSGDANSTWVPERVSCNYCHTNFNTESEWLKEGEDPNAPEPMESSP